MRAGGLFSILFAGLLLAPLSVASPEPEAFAAADCAALPPCGPITVLITIILEKSRGITFGDESKFETKGKVSYWFDIDQEGYWYDGTKEVWINFQVMKQPAWLKATVTPAKIQVPVRAQDGCTACIRTDPGDPSQIEFYWEGDVAVSVEKLREPTATELKKALKGDGTYRVSLSGSSNDSYVTKDPLGSTAGLQEGYGPKDLRFVPEGEAAKLIGVKGTAKARGAGADGTAPGIGLLSLLGVAALLVVSRRRE